jgi:hypothetical protein
MVMSHNLEEHIIKIENVANYRLPIVNVFGNADLEHLENFTGLTSPFSTFDDAYAFWQSTLNDVGEINLLEYWNTTLLPGQEQEIHIHSSYGWDKDDTISQYTAVLYSKFDPELHKPTYFADNPLKINEYKPSVREGDCIVFPSNIYHRAPLNTSDKNRIVSVCTFLFINKLK